MKTPAALLHRDEKSIELAEEKEIEDRESASLPEEAKISKLIANTMINNSYSANHWCNNPMKANARKFIALMNVKNHLGESREALVLLRGAAGYSCVVTLCDSKDPMRYRNKVPSLQDYEACLLAGSQVAGAFLRLGIFPQVELLCNNSHWFDKDRRLVLGNERTPFTTHLHVTGRGDPEHPYIGDVPLRGKVPYEVMIPRQRHQAWRSEEEVQVVAQGICKSLLEVKLHPDVSLIKIRDDIESLKKDVELSVKVVF